MSTGEWRELHASTARQGMDSWSHAVNTSPASSDWGFCLRGYLQYWVYPEEQEESFIAYI